ncbi:MAG: hypothetical protein AAFY17_10670 [Cyanobacteria bacterium J06642_11]
MQDTTVSAPGEILGLDNFIDHIVQCPRPGQLDQLISHATMPSVEVGDDLSLLEINFG